MENLEADEPERFLQLRTPEVSVPRNHIVCARAKHHDKVAPTCCLDAEMSFQSPCRHGKVNQEWKTESTHVVQHQEITWTPERRGVISAVAPAEVHEMGARGEHSWSWGPHQYERGPSRGEDGCSTRAESDIEEELEPPLPLRDDNDWYQHSPFLPPLHYMHNFNHHPMDVRFDCAEGGCYNLNPADRYPPQAPHFSHFCPPNWNDPENCCIRPQNDGSCFCGGVTCDSVTVNVPQVSVPPVECVSQVSVMNLSSPAEESVPELHQKRRTISLPQECQNVFITYSSDVSSEMVTFVDFLTKQGFRPAIDLFDNPIRRLDISKWTDTYLKDLSTPIIIAISPKYQADTEGSAVDSHGLQTKYINSTIQSQFIQQGCLNFRFIPVLFFGASQKHVPSWLQNTRVYRWPQDTEDLVLRLLREERYVPPPVPVELSLIIRPVTMSAATTLR